MPCIESGADIAPAPFPVNAPKGEKPTELPLAERCQRKAVAGWVIA